MLEAVHGNNAVMCTSLNGIKDSEKNVRTLKMVKECIATSFVTSHELVAKDHQITLILIWISCTLTWRHFIRFFLKV